MEDFVKSCTKSAVAIRLHKVQSLWSGYGEVVRIQIKLPEDEAEESELRTVILKSVSPPRDDTSVSHLRKLKSYDVEMNFYEKFSERCHGRACWVPRLLGAKRSCVAESVTWWFLLEDLDEYDSYEHPIDDSIPLCLDWLASFHATFLGEAPVGLWDIGTYWHLATRNEEWKKMKNDAGLKKAAAAIDSLLNSCKYKTFVHGDAKLDNFCFQHLHGAPVAAAVDFQYVGGGCGMKDVAYLLSSGWGGIFEAEFELRQEALLDHYFLAFRRAYADRLRRMFSPPVDLDDLEKEWRGLFHVAIADFNRFLCGWSPGHWSIVLARKLYYHCPGRFDRVHSW